MGASLRPKGRYGAAGSQGSFGPSKGKGQPSTKGRNCLPEKLGTACQGDTGSLSPLLEAIVGFPENPSMARVHMSWAPALSSAPFPLLTTPLPPASLVFFRPAVQFWPFFCSGISHCRRLSLSTLPSCQAAHSYLFSKWQQGDLAAPRGHIFLKKAVTGPGILPSKGLYTCSPLLHCTCPMKVPLKPSL